MHVPFVEPDVGRNGGWRQKLFVVPIFGSRRFFISLKTLSNRSRCKIDRSVKLLLNFMDCYVASGHLILLRHDMALGHTGRQKPRLMNRPLATGLAVQSS